VIDMIRYFEALPNFRILVYTLRVSLPGVLRFFCVIFTIFFGSAMPPHCPRSP